jgi:glycerophosphoryl diester phosphodiesterase
MLILGHKGYSAKYPPNTLLSFKKTIEYGADGVELDVWLTSDKKVVIAHDRNIEKITGADVDIKKPSYKELEDYTIEGEPIPLLEEVYEALPENAIINVEIKDVDAVKGSLKIAKKYNALDRTLFSSFNMQALKKLREISKEARIGILVGELNEVFTIPAHIYSLKAYYLNIPHQISGVGEFTARALIHFYRLFGVRVALWTPNSPDDLKLFEGLYEMVITDEVEKMVKFRDGKLKWSQN